MSSQTATPMSVEDARILALESGPIRGHTLKVLVLEGAPEALPVDELRADMSRRLTAERRWRQRLVPASGTPSGLAWQDDPEFDIARHVQTRQASARPVDDQELRRIVADIMGTPLDRGRPLWTLDVIPRLADGRSALVWKVHHCLADGMTTMRVGSQVLWMDEVPQARVIPLNRSAPPGSRAQVAAGMRLLRLAGYRGLLLREFRRVRDLSPLAGAVGSDRAVAFARCDLDELRALGKAVGPQVTVNDVLLSVVAGALRTWLRNRRLPITPMKVQVPVSMHPQLASADKNGNQDSFLFVSLPLSEPDPVARVRGVAKATRLRKNRHDARAIYALRQSLVHAPAPMRRALQHIVQGPHEYSLNVSNVPGPAGPISVAGRRVEALYSLAEVAPHHGLRVAAISLEGSLFVGLCADPQLVPDIDELAVGIEASVDDLHQRLGR